MTENRILTTQFSNVTFHTSNDSVAIAQTKAEFSRATLEEKARAVIFEGYENPELEAYLDNCETYKNLIGYASINLDQDNRDFRNRYADVFYDAVMDWASVLNEATNKKEFVFKMLYPNIKRASIPHKHWSTDILYMPDKDAEATAFEGGNALPRKPFLMKPHFEHKMPESSVVDPRPIITLSVPYEFS